jgi:hypothetical protein
MFLIYTTTILLATPQVGTPAGTERPGDDRPSIACSLSTPEKRARAREVRESLTADVRRVEETPDGFRAIVERGEAELQRLARFVALESDCCSFLTFLIEVEPSRDTLSLRVSGPEAAREVLREMASMLEP